MDGLCDALLILLVGSCWSRFFPKFQTYLLLGFKTLAVRISRLPKLPPFCSLLGIEQVVLIRVTTHPYREQWMTASKIQNLFQPESLPPSFHLWIVLNHVAQTHHVLSSETKSKPITPPAPHATGASNQNPEIEEPSV